MNNNSLAVAGLALMVSLSPSANTYAGTSTRSIPTAKWSDKGVILVNVNGNSTNPENIAWAMQQNAYINEIVSIRDLAEELARDSRSFTEDEANSYSAFIENFFS
jgi:hypothetical protein